MKTLRALAVLLAIATPAIAQTPNRFFRMQGTPQHGYIEIPADPQLDTVSMTVEAWVNVLDPTGGCSSIAGNGWTKGWWVGVCGTRMRSYFNGQPSLVDGGMIPPIDGAWVHIAATTDGVTRRHYINGELVVQQAETAPRSTSPKTVRIGSDPEFDFMPAGGIDDLRIWSVARTRDQIRKTMFAYAAPLAGDPQWASLEAWYRFEGDGKDAWHSHHGTVQGSGTSFATGFPYAPPLNVMLKMQGDPQKGYVEIPADPQLDAAAMTVEAWVSVRDVHTPVACSSIAGNGYIAGWWLGICGTSMRSYFNGVSSVKTGGTIPDTVGVWVHIAAVTDGTTRRHYINGELVFESAETAPRSTSPKPVRIGSDPDWDFQPAGAIDDVRIWSVARTQAQIRATMFALTVPNPSDALYQGLEAWYRFEGSALDSWRTHHGTLIGAGLSYEYGYVFSLPPKHRSIRR